MGDFLVHVVLHKAKLLGDYDTLHTAMKSKGFIKWVKGRTGKKWKLPPAEFRYVGDETILQVKAFAIEAAEETDHTFSLFVAAWSGAWESKNLEPFKEDE